jgi:secreted trypsin-like serine protease
MYLKVFCFLISIFYSVDFLLTEMIDNETMPLLEHLKTENDIQEDQQNSRIINGLSAKRGQFPYNVYILLTKTNNKSPACGGSLIKMNWILTAAHCMTNVTSGLIYAGTVDLANGPFSSINYFNRSQIFVHPGYTTSNVQNDIALIKLNEVIPCNKFVGIIDLPCNCESLYDLDELDAIVMGFGLTNINESTTSTTMKYTDLQIISNSMCKKSYPNLFTNGIICTVSKSFSSPCKGDSGSSLVADISGRRILVGVVSFGKIDCSPDKDSFQYYTRVSFYVNWIKSIIKLN